MTETETLIRTNSPAERVLEAIRYYDTLYGGMPAYKIISERAGVSVHLVPDYVRILKEKGLIRSNPDKEHNKIRLRRNLNHHLRRTIVDDKE